MAENKDFKDLGFISEDEFQKLGFIPEESASNVQPSPNKEEFSFPGVNSTIGKALQGGATAFVEGTGDFIVDPATRAGVAQGATLGLSDELGASKDIGIDLATQAVSLEVPNMLGVPDKWRMLQKERELANKKLQAESPYHYLGGEAVGTLLTAPLAPSVGAPFVGAAKSVPKLTKLIQAGELTTPELKALGSQTPGLISRLGGKATTSMIESAPIGAIGGVGYSDADVSRPAELAMDAISGMEMASLAGAGMSLSGNLIKDATIGAINRAKKYDLGRQAEHMWNMGDEGIALTTSAGQDVSHLLERDIPTTFTKNIIEYGKLLGKEVGSSIDDATKAGVKIDIGDELNQSTDNLLQYIMVDNPRLSRDLNTDSKKIIQTLTDRNQRVLTPDEARGLKNTLLDLINNVSGDPGNVYTANQAYKIISLLDDKLKNTPGMEKYKKASEKYAKFHSAVPETILEPGIDPKLRKRFYSEIDDKENKLLLKTDQMLSDAYRTGDVGKSRLGLIELEKNIQDLSKELPDLPQTLTLNTESFLPKTAAPEGSARIKALADKMAAMKQARGIDPHVSPGQLAKGTLVGAGKGYALGGINTTAFLKRTIQDSKPATISKAVYNYSNDNLIKMAQWLKSSKVKGFSGYGEKLERALLNKDESSKNAVLFTLLQDKDFREFLKSEGLED